MTKPNAIPNHGDKWLEPNDRYTTAAIAWVRALLAQRMPPSKPEVKRIKQRRGFLGWLFGRPKYIEEIVSTGSMPGDALLVEEAAKRLNEIESDLAASDIPVRIQHLQQRFKLSQFEVHVLLFCLAFELDTRIGWMCGAIQDQPYRPYPTFGLAMTLFDDPDWLALPPEGRLRKCRLVEFHHPMGTPLFGAELRLEETILHYLRGVPSLDHRLRTLATPSSSLDRNLLPSHQRVADRIGHMLSTNASDAFQIVSSDSAVSLAIAARVARKVNLHIFRMSLESLPVDVPEMEEFARLWNRDNVLFGLALAIDVNVAGSSMPSVDRSRLIRLTTILNSPVLVSTAQRIELAGVRNFCIEVPQTTTTEQHAIWSAALPADAVDRSLAGELAHQFTFDPASANEIVAIAGESTNGTASSDLEGAIWQECRERSRPKLEGLAQRIAVHASWNDLVVSQDRQRVLRQIRDQVNSRWRVYNEWGWGARMSRGLGVAALFCGESGTGKTMAAEVLANDLELDLFRVDLSMVVNKYIGETEKHLRRLFDAFESCGAILFFDECDALFGKRSEVKDSHDRYANIEINYLLQRLESYRGLAIMATNARDALDNAFLRRLRFVVTFPMPTEDERKQMWLRLLSADEERRPVDLLRIPVAELDYQRLADFPFSGGSIHNVVLNAAFRAAARKNNHRVTMSDVLLAAKDEYMKLERPINEADFVPAEPVSEEVMV